MRARSPRQPVWLLSSLLVTFVLCATGAENATEPTAPKPGCEHCVHGCGNSNGLDLPPFEYPIKDGLYATITALSSLEEKKFENEEDLKLKDIPGFDKDFEVSVMWQKRAAPLAVVLLGLGSRKESRMARYFQRHLYDAGCHVLTFDSPFLPKFHNRSKHGVAGNLKVEAQLAANLVETFLKHKDARGKVTKIGVVGASYGATLALVWANLQAQGKVSLKPDRILALSPPVSMQESAARLDRFWSEDRWDYKLSDLYSDLNDHKPVAPGQAVPFEAAKMRAGLAAAFRLDLKDVVDHNDRRYKLNMLPKAGLYDDQYRRDWAETWTFTRFIEQMSYAYWVRHGKVISVADLWRPGNLFEALPECPAYVRVVLTPDDPLNEPGEVTRLQSACDGKLTVLPSGGHLGYLSTEWCKARLKKLFE